MKEKEIKLHYSSGLVDGAKMIRDIVDRYVKSTEDLLMTPQWTTRVLLKKILDEVDDGIKGVEKFKNECAEK